jgi:hypothetical protein
VVTALLLAGAVPALWWQLRRRLPLAVILATAALVGGATALRVATTAPGVAVPVIDGLTFLGLIVLGLIVAGAARSAGVERATLAATDIGDGTQRLSAVVTPAEDRTPDRRGIAVGLGLVVIAGLSWGVSVVHGRGVSPLPGADAVVKVEDSSSPLVDLEPIEEFYIDQLGDSWLRINYLMTRHPWCYQHSDVWVAETEDEVSIRVRIGRLSDPESDAVFDSIGQTGGDLDVLRCVSVGERVVEHRWADVYLTDPLGDRAIYAGG